MLYPLRLASTRDPGTDVFRSHDKGCPQCARDTLGMTRRRRARTFIRLLIHVRDHSPDLPSLHSTPLCVSLPLPLPKITNCPRWLTRATHGPRRVDATPGCITWSEARSCLSRRWPWVSEHEPYVSLWPPADDFQ